MTSDELPDPPSHDPRDAEFIQKSLRMLPPWDWRDWWDEFCRISGSDRVYLDEKLSILLDDWSDYAGAWSRAPYVLMFFDNPALYEHLDAVAGSWESPIPGRAGQRWSQQICQAAWRALVADDHHSPYHHNFQIPDDDDQVDEDE
jgi:hypothetical protein